VFDIYNMWKTHRIILPEAREMIINRCCDCRFFICIQGVQETRYGCVECIPQYHSLSTRVPNVIFVMDLMKMAGRDGLIKIMEKGNPGAQACEIWMPRVAPKKGPQ
jgi:hypothetical protein